MGYAQPQRQCDRDRRFVSNELLPVHPQAEARRRAETLKDLIKLAKLLTKQELT